jgi:IS605 OrfB family transposase
MKLTAKIKLLPTKEQADTLKRTLETANAACDHISQVAWDSRTFGRNKLHPKVYSACKIQFGLSAQMVCRAIQKVVDSYKLDKATQRTFRPLGGIAYDSRILRYKVDSVSIWTVDGRQCIPFVSGDYQAALLAHQKGESDLILVGGQFYLCATCEVPTVPTFEPLDVLGVDLGIVNIATDSDGQTFSGSRVNNVRHRHRRLRKKLQSKGTKSAKRRLKKLSGKEARFATDVNHVISKSIVAKAQGTTRAIALEALTGIRDRVTARKSQRATLHSWSFYQLKGFISYKAQLAGVPLIEVDPRNTSRTCPVCGCVDKHNRKSQSSFICTQCGFAGLADYIASVNIRRRAQVNAPNVSTTFAIVSPTWGMAVVQSGTSP